MARKAIELNMFGDPFEEKPTRQDGPTLQLDDWSNRTIRRLMIGGEPWWVAADIARVLGYSHTPHAIRLLAEDEKGVHEVDTPGGEQEMTIVNESGLYRLVMNSKKPEAEAFRRWVFHEVLPSIRRTGSYSSHNNRIERLAKRLRTDDPATLLARQEQSELNARLNQWLANAGFKPVDFIAFHTESHVLLHGNRPRDIKPALGLKRYQTVLDRMGPVLMSLHSAIKNLAMQFIRDEAEARGAFPSTAEQKAMLARAAEAILSGSLQNLGFEYGVSFKDDAERGRILDLVRRQIEAPN